MTKIKWEGAGTPLPSGHRLFESHDKGNGESGWAIVDMSGRMPEDSDDGILWLDQSRPLKVGTRHAATVPVIDTKEAQASVPIDATSLLVLSKMFRWTIYDDIRGHYYNVI